MADLDEDYIDITNDKKIYLTRDQIDMIKENPAGLTKEGCMKEVENWSKSKNKYTLSMYKVMVKKCPKLQPSNKTKEGKHVFSRMNGKVTWAGELESDKQGD